MSSPTPFLRFLLERARVDQGLPPATTIDLPDDQRVRELAVTPHDLETYDSLLSVGDDRDAGGDCDGNDRQSEEDGDVAAI